MANGFILAIVMEKHSRVLNSDGTEESDDEFIHIFLLENQIKIYQFNPETHQSKIYVQSLNSNMNPILINHNRVNNHQKKNNQTYTENVQHKYQGLLFNLESNNKRYRNDNDGSNSPKLKKYDFKKNNYYEIDMPSYPSYATNFLNYKPVTLFKTNIIQTNNNTKNEAKQPSQKYKM